MKNYEGIGYAIGFLIGAAATGICVYLTQSILPIFARLICAYLGGRIGKSIKKPEK